MTGFDSKRQMAQAKLYTTSPAAQPEQEPVAWISHNAGLYHFKPDESLDPLPLYLAPPAAQRPWQGLTDEDWAKIGDMPDTFDQGVAWAAARLKERNT